MFADCTLNSTGWGRHEGEWFGGVTVEGNVMNHEMIRGPSTDVVEQ